MKNLLPIAAVVLCVGVAQTSALCCPWALTANAKCQCDDGSLVHPWECCATGGCNVFCCNCAGECLKPQLIDMVGETFREKRSLDMSSGARRGSAEHFASIDLNRDMVLDRDEVWRFIQVRSGTAKTPFNEEIFNQMDSNSDGFIQPYEMDELLTDDDLIDVYYEDQI